MAIPTDRPIDRAESAASELRAVADLITSADDLHCVRADELAMLMSNVARRLDAALDDLASVPRRRLHSV